TDQDHLDAADSVHSAPRSIRIFGSHAYPHDVAGEFSERPSELAPDVSSIFGAEIALCGADVSRDGDDRGPGFDFRKLRKRRGKGKSLQAIRPGAAPDPQRLRTRFQMYARCSRSHLKSPLLVYLSRSFIEPACG